MKIADLFIKLGLKSKDFDKGIDKAKNKTNAFSSAMKKVGGIIAGAFAVERILSFASELVKLGGEAEGVRAAFERIGGMTYLDDLKRATAGTVSELDLMKRAVSAKNLGLPIENLASLFEFATKRAQDTGESVDYLVNSIVTGIGRKSPLILDNLGISAVQLREKLNGVGLQTASTADVAAAVGEIAAEAMRESGKVIETNAIKLQQLASAWADVKMEFAEDPELTNMFGGLLNFATAFVANIPQMIKDWKKWGDTFNAVMSGGISLLWKRKKVTEETTESQKEQNKETEEFKNLLGEITVNSEENNEAWKKRFEIWEKNNERAAKHNDLLESIEDTHRAINKFLKSNIEDSKKFFETSNIASQDDIISSFKGMPKLDEEQEYDTSNFEKIAAQQREQAERALANFEAFKQDMAYAVTDFGIEVVDEFGRAMGQLIATGEFPENFGNNILRILGNFLSGLGKMMISLGVASEAFQALLKSAFASTPAAIALIAGGAALVAIGGAISSSASSYPSGTSSANGGYNISTVDSQDRQLVAKVSGRDLAFVLQKQTNYTDRT